MLSHLPTTEQAVSAVQAVSEILGALYTLCTVIGNPLAKYSTGRVSAAGHLILAFGADIGKARKRINELFSSGG
jgi:hypothetical protein